VRKFIQRGHWVFSQSAIEKSMYMCRPATHLMGTSHNIGVLLSFLRRHYQAFQALLRGSDYGDLKPVS
jgi:hypothetical protein